MRMRSGIRPEQRDKHRNRPLIAAWFQTCGLARWQWIVTGAYARHATRVDDGRPSPLTRRGRPFALRVEPRSASRP